MGQFHNQRGTARRHAEKNVRVATHSSVLRTCAEAMSGSFDVLEHGMGVGSTPLIHSFVGLRTLLSYETDTQWMNCSTCDNNESVWSSHVVLNPEPLAFASEAKRVLGDANDLIVLADGPGPEREKIIEVAMELSATFIIEHDAETYFDHDILRRRWLAQKHGYTAYQFIDEEPETALFIKNTAPRLELSTGSYVAL